MSDEREHKWEPFNDYTNDRWQRCVHCKLARQTWQEAIGGNGAHVAEWRLQVDGEVYWVNLMPACGRAQWTTKALPEGERPEELEAGQ